MIQIRLCVCVSAMVLSFVRRCFCFCFSVCLLPVLQYFALFVRQTLQDGTSESRRRRAMSSHADQRQVSAALGDASPSSSEARFEPRAASLGCRNPVGVRGNCCPRRASGEVSRWLRATFLQTSMSLDDTKGKNLTMKPSIWQISATTRARSLAIAVYLNLCEDRSNQAI